MKQLNRIFLLLLSVTVVANTYSCSSSGDRVELPNRRSFLAAAGERILSPDARDEKRYRTYFNNLDSIQIPLFRSVYHSDYTLFLGIPIGTTIENLHTTWADAFPETVAVENSACVCTFQDEKLVARCLLESSPGNLLLLGFLFATTDVSKVANLLSNKNLSKRILSDENS